MACCSGRCFLVIICLLQLIAVVEKQVFDFLGYMWAPIIANFLQIIFVIIGLFGAVQYRHRVVIVYTTWCLLWIGWNIFVICFYLEVGMLNRDSPILNIGTGNKSWWRDHGFGCTTNSTCVETSLLPEGCVQGCLLQYYYVETIQAGTQCILALLGFCVSCYVVCVFTEEDDASQPVHDELEYIKMRYRSPARSSFRDQRPQKPSNMNKGYDDHNTLTTQTYSDRGDNANNTGNYSDESSLETTQDSARSNRRMLPKTDGDGKNKKKSKNNKNEVDLSKNAKNGNHGDLWATTDGERPDIQQIGTGGRGRDFGYESYDSRHQLVVAPSPGQTVI